MKATIDWHGKQLNLRLVTNNYQNNRLAIQAIDEDNHEPFGTLTVNLPECPLRDDCVFIKTWSENTWVLPVLEQFPEVFEDTGKRVPTGFCEAQVWKVKQEI